MTSDDFDIESERPDLVSRAWAMLRDDPSRADGIIIQAYDGYSKADLMEVIIEMYSDQAKAVEVAQSLLTEESGG